MTAPQPGFKIQTFIQPNGNIAQETTDLAGQVCRTFIRTKDQQIRHALIQLGWTTPELGQAIKRIAAIAHGGGLIGYSDIYAAMDEIRRLSKPWVADQVDTAQRQVNFTTETP